jgi:hypothetical protein
MCAWVRVLVCVCVLAWVLVLERACVRALCVCVCVCSCMCASERALHACVLAFYLFSHALAFSPSLPCTRARALARAPSLYPLSTSLSPSRVHVLVCVRARACVYLHALITCIYMHYTNNYLPPQDRVQLDARELGPW